MNGTVDGPGTGFMADCMGQMMGGGLVFLLLIAVLILAAAALIKYLRRPT